MAEGFPLSPSAPCPHLKKTEGNVLIVLTLLSSVVCGKVVLKDPHLTLLNTPFTHEGVSAQYQGFNIQLYTLNGNFSDFVSK